MVQPRRSIRGIVLFCWFSAVSLIIVLLAYLGFFDGLGEALYEMLKPIAKFFFQ